MFGQAVQIVSVRKIRAGETREENEREWVVYKGYTMREVGMNVG